MKPSFVPFSALCGATLLALACLGTPAHATLLVNADFDTGYSTGSLFGQSGSSDVGLSGSFAQGASTGVASVVNSSVGGRNLTYTVSGGGTISGGTHSVDISGALGTTQDIFHRSLSSEIQGQSLFMRVVIRPVTALNNNTFMRFYVTPDVPATNATGGLNGAAFGLRDASGGVNPPGANAMMNNAGTVYTANTGANVLTVGFPSLLVAKFNWNGSAYDSASIWVNPTATASGSPLATTSFSFAPTSLDTMGLGIVNFGAGQIVVMDSFAIGTQWSDVVAVPEPSTWALLVLGVGAIAFFRRKVA